MPSWDFKNFFLGGTFVLCINTCFLDSGSHSLVNKVAILHESPYYALKLTVFILVVIIIMLLCRHSWIFVLFVWLSIKGTERGSRKKRMLASSRRERGRDWREGGGGGGWGDSKGQQGGPSEAQAHPEWGGPEALHRRCVSSFIKRWVVSQKEGCVSLVGAVTAVCRIRSRPPARQGPQLPEQEPPGCTPPSYPHRQRWC